MLCACEYLKTGCRLSAESVVGKHSLYCKLHCKLGASSHKSLVVNFLKTADVTGVVTVELLLVLLTGEGSLSRIYDDNELAAINVGGELGSVLAAKDGSSCNSG